MWSHRIGIPAPAPRRDLARGVVDRARDVVGCLAAGHASPGHVDDGSCPAELGRNPATGAAACTRDQCDLLVEGFHLRAIIFFSRA